MISQGQPSLGLDRHEGNDATIGTYQRTKFIKSNILGSLATLFMMLMMKIGFFVEEGIPVDVMNSVLMFIMFFPLFVAVYIISAAIHEAFAAHFKKVVWPKWKAAVKTILGKAWKVFDAQTKYAY